MMGGPGTPDRWWLLPPARRVSFLAGADPELLRLALDPLPPAAPAVVTYRPAPHARVDGQVAGLLDALEQVAIATFPRWLPGAERLDQRCDALAVAAVGALAAQAAARSPDFGPFLAETAVAALTARGGGAAGGPDSRAGRSPLPAEVRAAGLARVIAEAYGRSAVALLIELPPDLAPADEQSLVAAAEWLAARGGMTVWLAGAPLIAVDRVRSVAVRLPASVTSLVDTAKQVDPAKEVDPATQVEAAPQVGFPPLSGTPRWDSPAEQTLERALARCAWATGRLWNHTYGPQVLSRPYRLDLFWPREGLVVEVDGPEHRRPLPFADDRRRDAALQVLGHAVLRFTNDHILDDVQSAVAQIRKLLLDRRRAAQNHQTEVRQDVHY